MPFNSCVHTLSCMEAALEPAPAQAGQEVAQQAGAAAQALALWQTVRPQLEQRACLRALQKIEMPLSPVLARMEALGLAVDCGHLKAQLVGHLHIPCAAQVSQHLNSRLGTQAACTGIGACLAALVPRQARAVLCRRRYSAS